MSAEDRLGDIRAEGAVALTRRGQRVTVALAQNQNEVHVVAGPSRRWTAIATHAKYTRKVAKKKLAARKDDVGGPAWAATRCWAPCCAGEGAASPRRRASPRGEDYEPAHPRGPPAKGKKAKPITSRVLMAPDHRVAAFAVDPETDVLYTGSDKGALIAWDLRAGVPWWSIPSPMPAPGVRPVPIKALQFCKGVLSATSEDGQLRGIDPDSGKELWSVSGAGVASVVITAGTIFCGSYDHSVRAIEADTGIERWSFVKHKDVVRALAHSHGRSMHLSGEKKSADAGTLFTGGWDCTVRAVNDETGKQDWVYKKHKRPIAALSVACGKDGGTILFTASYDGTVRALRVADGSEVWKFKQHTQPVRGLWASALEAKGLRSGVASIENYVERLTGVDLDGDGDVGVLDRAGVVFTAAEDGKVFALDGGTGEELWKHERHTRRVVEISEALGVVFSVADDQTVRAIQATSGEELWCSRWAWGRHGPPPERGSVGFMSKAVNFVEKKTGVDLDRDGDVGVVGEESAAIALPKYACLQVSVLECRGLTAMDGRFGSNDVFVTLDCDGDVQKSSTVTDGGTAPAWLGGAGETLVFRSSRTPERLGVEAFDEDVGSAHDSIGSGVVAMTDVVKEERNWSACRWVGLTNAKGKAAGEARLFMRWGVPTPTDAPQEWQLQVTVLECDGLKKMDLTGKNDVYVKLRVDGAEGPHRSSTIEGGGAAPVWGSGTGETMTFRLGAPPPSVGIEVFDEDKGSADDLIGTHVLEVGTQIDGEEWNMEDSWLDLTSSQGKATGRVRVGVGWSALAHFEEADVETLEAAVEPSQIRAEAEAVTAARAEWEEAKLRVRLLEGAAPGQTPVLRPAGPAAALEEYEEAKRRVSRTEQELTMAQDDSLVGRRSMAGPRPLTVGPPLRLSTPGGVSSVWWPPTTAEQEEAEEAERDRIQALVETRSRMEEIYRAKRPEKIKDIIPLLAEWEGEEHVLLSKIEAKYKC